MEEIEKTRRIRDIDYYKMRVNPGKYPAITDGSELIRRQLFDVMKPGHSSQQVGWRIGELEDEEIKKSTEQPEKEASDFTNQGSVKG